MLEQIRRCKHCGRTMMDVSHLSWKENPYCTTCFNQRLSESSKKTEASNWHIEGQYLVFTPK